MKRLHPALPEDHLERMALLGQLLGSTADQLRGLLAVAQAAMELDIELSPPGPQDHRQPIVESIKRAGGVLELVLELIHPASARRNGDVAEAFRWVGDLFRHGMAASVPVVQTLHAPVPPVAVSTSCLQLILAILVQSAVEAVARHDGATGIQLDAYRHGDRLCLTIGKSGGPRPVPPHPPAPNPSPESSEADQSRDIGPLIACRLLERLGGSLAAGSADGEVLFTVMIPLAEPAHDPSSST